MFGFLSKVGDYTRDAVGAAKYITQGLGVTFDHLSRRPVTVQYPYEKLIPSERYRGASTTNLTSALLVRSVFGSAQSTCPSSTG